MYKAIQNISILTLNAPGLKAAEELYYDLLSINSDFRITIYHKITNLTAKTKSDYVLYDNLDEILDSAWKTGDALIWFAATGIVVRKTAPFLNSKTSDPAVLIMNFSGTQVIPLLSGHIGGANELAQQLAELNPKLTCFLTTATDLLDVFAFDMYAKKAGFEILNIEELAKISNSLINNNPVNLITYPRIKENLEKEGLTGENIIFFNYEKDLNGINPDCPTVIITPFLNPEISEKFKNLLKIKIKPISLGIGLNKNTSGEELFNDISKFMLENDLNLKEISTLASFEAKKDEDALKTVSLKLNANLLFFTENEINKLEGDFSPSKATDFFKIKGVAEPTAILAAPFKTLFIKKKINKNTTIAAAF